MKKLTLTVFFSCFVLAITAQAAGALEKRAIRKNLKHSGGALVRVNSPKKVGGLYPTVSNPDAERYSNGAMPILAGH